MAVPHYNLLSAYFDFSLSFNLDCTNFDPSIDIKIAITPILINMRMLTII